MNFAHAQKIADAVLYEGYLLYPYRASAIKNVHRFNFGALYPSAGNNRNPPDMPVAMHTECLVVGAAPIVETQVRFLHLISRQVRRFAEPLASLPADAEANSSPVPALEIAGKQYATWDEAEPRDVRLPNLHLDSSAINRLTFSLPAARSVEPLRDPAGQFVGLMVRDQQAVEGVIETSAARLSHDLFKLSTTVRNCTPAAAPLDSSARPIALQRSLLALHALLGVERGEFVSLLDPPESLRDAVASCQNAGVWPVLAAEPPARDVLLASPIILYDYPAVAPESAGDYFDGAEIDEMLALRIMTLTDDEKREMRDLDDRSRQLLERTESLSPDDLAKLHGAVRDFMVR